jgi:hypothetical protein
MRTLAALLFFTLSVSAEAAPCKFKVIPAPTLFKLAAGENTEIKNAIAFTTPTCKIVAVGAHMTGSIYIGRFLKGGLSYDATYGTNGLVKQPMKSRFGNIAMKFQPLKGKVALTGFAWNESEWTGGVFLSFLSPEGVFDTEAYVKGMGYKMLIGNHASNDFKVLKTTVIKNTLEIESSYFDRAVNKAITTKTIFATIKPKMTAKKVPVPTDCGSWNYNGTMLDGLVVDIKQNSCSSLSFNWRYSAWPPSPGWYDSYTISPDGSCTTARMFGEACYYYENGDLVREFISANTWEPMKYYMKVMNVGGYLCGISTGSAEPKLISSPYPSTHEKFLKTCTWY